MQNQLLNETPEIKFDPSYHDLYNDLFYKNVIFPNKKMVIL